MQRLLTIFTFILMIRAQGGVGDACGFDPRNGVTRACNAGLECGKDHFCHFKNGPAPPTRRAGWGERCGFMQWGQVDCILDLKCINGRCLSSP